MLDKEFRKINKEDTNVDPITGLNEFQTITNQFLENQKAWIEQNKTFYFEENSKDYPVYFPKSPLILKQIIEDHIIPALAKLSEEKDPDLKQIAKVNKQIASFKELEILPRGVLRELNAKKFYKNRLCLAWIDCLRIVAKKLQNSGLFPHLESLDFSYAITMNYSSVQVVIANNRDGHPLKYSLVRGLPIFSVPVKHETVETYCTSNIERKLSTSAFYQNLRAGNIRAVKRGGANASWLVSCGVDSRSTASKKQEYTSTLYVLDEMLDEPVIKFLNEFEISTDTRYIRIWQQKKDAFIVETYTKMPIFTGKEANYDDLYVFNAEARRVLEDCLLSYTGITPLFDLPLKTVFL